MRGHMQLTAPLIIACSALLLCIGVIAGLTGSLIMQASNPGRSAPATPASLTPVDARGATAPAPGLGSALFQADIPTDLLSTIPPAANPSVPAPAPTPPPAAVVATPPAPPVPAVEASQPPNAPLPSGQTSQPPAPPAPAAYVPQPPASQLQESPPMVGAVTSAAEAQGNEVDPATFQQDLQPMGQWVATPDYGDCWVPQGVAVGWRPYTAGRWVYTECGWTWLSEEPWGHITYHYGSWVDYPSHGWIWVPGRVWAPAWVAWRVGGGYVGWAPLPPAACRRDIPVAHAVVMRIPTPYFCFVGERDFGDDHIGRRMRPINQNVTIIVQTRNSTRIEFSRTTVVNRSLTVVQVEHMTGRRPREVRLERSDNNHDAEQRRGRGEPVAYRPRPQPRDERRDPPTIRLPGLPKPPFSLPTPPLPPLPGIQGPRVRPGDPKLPKPPVVRVPGLPTPPIPVPTPPIRVPRPPAMIPGDPASGRKPVPAPPVIVPPGLPIPPVRTPRPPAVRPVDPTPGRKPVPAPPVIVPPGLPTAPVPAPIPPIRTPRPPAVRPVDPTPAQPVPQPTPGSEKRPSSPSDPTKLPPPPQRPIADNKPAPTPPPAARPADPQPRPADPQPTPGGEKRPSFPSDPTKLPPPPQRPIVNNKPTPTPPPAARPADPQPRPADPQPAPRPTRDRGNTDAPSANNPPSPPAVRPPDPPQRRPNPEPTPPPEKRRERAPEQAPPPAAPPADPAPARQEPRARSQPPEAPQRRRPAPADNATDDQTTPPGQTPDNPGRGGGARRGGR